MFINALYFISSVFQKKSSVFFKNFCKNNSFVSDLEYLNVLCNSSQL